MKSRNYIELALVGTEWFFKSKVEMDTEKVEKLGKSKAAEMKNLVRDQVWEALIKHHPQAAGKLCGPAMWGVLL